MEEQAREQVQVKVEAPLKVVSKKGGWLDAWGNVALEVTLVMEGLGLLEPVVEAIVDAGSRVLEAVWAWVSGR